METFEFKSAICTSEEQSKRLLELGLKRETADMGLVYITHDFGGKEIEPEYLGESIGLWSCDERQTVFCSRQKQIPAWSLHRLLLLLNCAYVELDANNPFEDCITRIEFLIKESKIFNKDYLEDKK